MRAGFTPAEIVFTGVGKTDAELERAISLGLRSINAESEGEIERIDAIATARGVKARVAVRVNPDIDAKSHPHISTGLKSNKFGVAIADAREMCLRMRGSGAACRSSGCTATSARKSPSSSRSGALPKRWSPSPRELRDAGVAVEHLDIGGGLGIAYEGQRVPTAAEYAAQRAADRPRERPQSHSRAGTISRRTGRHAARDEWSTSSRRRAASCS